MKVISMATPTHRQLEEEWFLASFKDECRPQVLHVDDKGPGGGYWRTEGFDAAVRRKIQYIADTVAAHRGELIMWADVDIQFFQPVVPILETLMQGKDMLFQRGNHRHEEVCSGLFVCRASWKTLIFWRTAQLLMRYYSYKGDQAVTNMLLGMLKKRPRTRRAFNLFGIHWDYLPDSFYCPGVNYSMLWNPGDALPIPDPIHLHHANFTKGVSNKLAQFAYVRDIVAARKGS
mgnify:CR=1 FL=1